MGGFFLSTMNEAGWSEEVPLHAQEVLVPLRCYTDALRHQFEKKKKVAHKLKASRSFKLCLEPCPWPVVRAISNLFGHPLAESPTTLTQEIRNPRQLDKVFGIGWDHIPVFTDNVADGFLCLNPHLLTGAIDLCFDNETEKCTIFLSFLLCNSKGAIVG